MFFKCNKVEINLNQLQCLFESVSSFFIVDNLLKSSLFWCFNLSLFSLDFMNFSNLVDELELKII